MIGIIGDLHFKDSLGYADYIDDRREGERKEVLDFIVESFEDCDKVVMLGDQLNARNNTSESIRAFVEFVERFNNKELYIIAGNHEKRGNGKSAIDFLQEIKKPNLKVFIREVGKVGGLVFCPYFTKSEMDAKDNDEGLRKLLEGLPGGDILFCHHAISDTLVQSGLSTNIFDEIVLPKKELESRFKLVVGGHIHKPEAYGNTVVSGSIFNNEVGEMGKSIWKISEKDFTYTEVPLPGRKIQKFENPALDDVQMSDDTGVIAKVIITDKKINIDELRKAMKCYDAVIISEQYASERKKVKNQETLIDFGIENLLGVYSKEKNVDLKLLMNGFNIIKGV